VIPRDDDLARFAADGTPELPHADRDGWVDRDGARIRFASYGSGAPVVLLHGGLGHSGNWFHQLAALRDSGRQVVLIDSRGHGRSTRDGRPYAYAAMADDVLAVMDMLGITRAALVGWSDGAVIALDLARRFPARAAGVFFFACNVDPTGTKAIDERNPLLGRCFSRHMKDYARLSATPNGFAAFADAVGAMQRSQPNYSAADLAAIRTPVTIVHAEHDEFIERAHADYLARTIPGARFVFLPDVSHFAPLQRPDEFNAAILDFLRAVDRPSAYVLGHTATEHDRLARQAARLAPHTERMLRDAGIRPGLRVLDVGSGVGDVALLAARLVGPSGSVVGVDRDNAALDRARARAADAGFKHVRFVASELGDFDDADGVDAVIGRFVLQFTPDPIPLLRRLVRLVRPGGLVAFHEANWATLLAQCVRLPLRRVCAQLVHDAIARGGAHTNMEQMLWRGYRDIGLTSIGLTLETPIGDDLETRRWLFDLFCTVQPRFYDLGLSGAAVGDLPTLAARLDAELDAHHALAACLGLVGAWGRTPGTS